MRQLTYILADAIEGRSVPRAHHQEALTQLPHLGYAIAISEYAIVATMFSKRPFRDGIGGGIPHQLYLDMLAPRGIDVTPGCSAALC